jgi:hypothetical protein
LELYSTIIYIDNLYSKNISWGKSAEVVIKKVKELKPHFENEEIKEAYNSLEKINYLAS